MEKENAAPEHDARPDPASEYDNDEAEGRDYPSQGIQVLVACAIVYVLIQLARMIG